MLRPTTPADTPALLELAAATGVFKDHEIVALEEVLDDFHAENHTFGHRTNTWEEAGKPAGFVYFAPVPMTDNTWELWWIAVDVARQGQGLGGTLLNGVEEELRKLNGRLLLIETSSTPHYDPTRKFYLKHGYREAAIVPDFYCEGDSKVIYSKRL